MHLGPNSVFYGKDTMLGGFKHEETLEIVWFFHEVGPILGIDKDNRRSLQDAEKDRQAHARFYAKLASPSLQTPRRNNPTSGESLPYQYIS